MNSLQKRGRRVCTSERHAINQHTLILEVQQNSNTTYRIDDWNRTNSLGEARELHVEKALEVIEWNRQVDHLLTPTKTNT